MTTYERNGLFDKVFKRLYGRDDIPLARNHADVQQQLWHFAHGVWLHAMVERCDNSVKELYGRLIDVQEMLFEVTTPPNAVFPCQSFGPVRAQAFVAGLLFLSFLRLKRGQKQVRELACFLSVPLHLWLLNQTNSWSVFRGELFHLRDTCWLREPAVEELNGIMYLVVHLHGDPRDWYPGFTTFSTTKGRHVGEPHWPVRYAQHIISTTNPWARDGHLSRYTKYRELGRERLVGYPVYRDSPAGAYAREQQIIRDKRPPTTGGGLHTIRDERDPPERRGRRRQRQSGRRKLRRAQRASKFPPVLNNYNLVCLGKDASKSPDSTHGWSPMRNFNSLYHRLARSARAVMGVIGAPISILEKGRETLFTEFAATPGKRIDDTVGLLTKEQMAKCARKTQRIQTTYRRTLAERKFNVMFPQFGVPGPRTVFIWVRRTCSWLRAPVQQILNVFTSTTALRYPERANMAKEFTSVIDGRAPKVSENLFNEYIASEKFDLEQTEEFIRREGLEGYSEDTHFVRENWDVPRPADRDEMFSEMWRSIRGWIHHFHLKYSGVNLKLAKTILKDALRSLPRRAPPEGPIIPERFEDDEYARVRVDKDEHCMFIRPMEDQHRRLYQHYIADTESFERLPWTRSKAKTHLKTNYWLSYPARFRRKAKFRRYCVPRAVIRPKGKCVDERGLFCVKPGHAHERILVSTSRLPMHAQDRMFSRALQLMKMADGLPDCELWSLKDARKMLAASRGKLRVVPKWWHHCARCRRLKDQPGGCLARCACTSLYTKSDMQRLLSTTAPEMRERYERNTHRRTITVHRKKTVSGRVGGSPWATFRAQTFTTEECMEFLKYECGTNIFALGKGRKTLIIRQRKGCAMGGRASKVKTSILLGSGEGLLMTDEARLQRLGFAIPGYSIEELVSLVRLVDDGSCASFVFCQECMKGYPEAAWGEEQEVSVEEHGQRIRFTYLIESVHGGVFTLEPRYQNSDDPEAGPQVVRYIPAQFTPQPIRYIRSLASGRLARVQQICPANDFHVLRSMWELAVELHSPPNGFTWQTIRRGLSGIRNRPATTVLRRVRAMLRALERGDENIFPAFLKRLEASTDR